MPYSVESHGDWWIIKQKGFGRKRSYLIEVQFRNFLEGLRRITKNFN
jgi:hypothetical protein